MAKSLTHIELPMCQASFKYFTHINLLKPQWFTVWWWLSLLLFLVITTPPFFLSNEILLRGTRLTRQEGTGDSECSETLGVVPLI